MNQQRGRGPGPVPERWLRCPRKSANLVNGKFLVFKTPLCDRFDSQVELQYRFPVEMIFDSMKMYKIKVGLWIDLTNTTRFYDKKEVEERGCRYVKLQCKGRGETPNPEQTAAFAKLCDNFIRQNPLEVIGVHCTHGFNRSGFLITSYLVTMLDWDLDAALNEFARNRPPGIYKQDYLTELYRRYDDEESAREAPPLPDWCREFEGEDSDGEQHEQSQNEGDESKRKAESSGDEPNAKRKRRMQQVKENATFMEGVTGVELVRPPLLFDIQETVEKLCKWPSSGFPGSQPVSMTVKNVSLLSEKPYRVSWKADGVRYLMYIKNKDEIYCIDRDNCVFQVRNLTFRFRKDLNAYLKDTLLDGEMVIDKVNGANVPRYLVYDLISLLGYEMRKEPFFPKRYDAIKREIVEPRNDAMRKGLLHRQYEPFSVRLKEFFDVRDAGKFLTDKFAATLSHEPDGLIFQPSLEPYVAGRCEDVLKWKPASLNSVDFRLKIVVETGVGIVTKKIGELYVGGMEHRYDVIRSLKNIQHLDGKIIECTMQNGKWVFLRERTDKSFPNSYTTVQGVMESIKHPVTKEDLLEYIDLHRYMDDLMLPPPVPDYR